MSTEFLKQLLNESAHKPVVIAGSKAHVNEDQLPLAALGAVLEAAPNDCTPEQLGEAIFVAAYSISEDMEVDSTVPFDAMVEFIEAALNTAKALHADAQPE